MIYEVIGYCKQSIPPAVRRLETNRRPTVILLYLT